MREVGIRVGAICSGDEKTKILKFFGYGVYEGDFIPPANAGGFAQMCHEAEVTNPRIKLDNGNTVWGGECWWGPEDQIKKRVDACIAAGWKIEDVGIKKLRTAEKKAKKARK
jgi:hypothetical protein